MPKKSPSSSPAAKPRKKPGVARRSRSRLLLLVDNEPLYRAAIKDYEAHEERVRAEQEKIEAYYSADFPAYQRWEAKVFGPLLSEFRSTLQELDELRPIVSAIEEESYWSGCSLLTAYKRVMKAIEEEKAAAERGETTYEDHEDDFEPEEDEIPKVFGNRDLPEGFDIDVFDSWTKKQQADFRRSYKTMAGLYEFATGYRAPDLEDLLRRERAAAGGSPQGEIPRGHVPPGARAGDGAHDSKASRIKELYRNLVRQLHPDAAGEQTARDRELWHEVQAAYQAGDLERLEAVAGRVEIGVKGGAAKLPLSILRRLTRDLGEQLQKIFLEIGRLKKQPAWQFRKKAKQLPKLEAKRRQVLTHELKNAKSELATYKSMLDELKTRAERNTRTRGKKKQTRGGPEQSEFF